MIEKFINLLALGIFNKLAGAAFGTLKFAVIISVAILILNKFDVNKSLERKANGSLLFNPIAKLVPAIIPKLNVIKDEIKDLTKKPTEKENLKK